MNDILDLLTKFAVTTRYSSTLTMIPESIATHCGQSAVLAMIFAKKLGYDPNRVNRIMAHASTHDLEETLTGDVVASIKYYNPSILKEFKVIEKDAKAQLREIMGVDLDELDSELTEEDHLVFKLADYGTVLLKIYQELKIGNSFIFKALSPESPLTVRDYSESKDCITIIDTFIRPMEDLLIDLYPHDDNTVKGWRNYTGAFLQSNLNSL